MHIKIANIREYINGENALLPKGFFYVGRPSPRFGLKGSGLANPYKIGQYPTNSRMHPLTLEDTLYWYRIWLFAAHSGAKIHELALLRSELKKHGEITLCCWCPPKPCHAEIIREALLQYGEFEVAK